MTDRETFLERVRERRRQQYPFPVSDLPKPVEVSVLEDDVPASELIDHFARMLEDVGGRVIRVSDGKAAREWLAGFVTERGMERAVITRDVLGDDWSSALADAGLAVTLPPAGDTVGHAAGEAFRRACIDADVGVTGADFAVADTGTLALLARSGSPRTASLLPPVHVAVIHADQFVANLPALIDRLRGGAWRDGLPSAMTLITGPSRTGDIEQTLSVGVHGPGEVYVVVLLGHGETQGGVEWVHRWRENG
ncbi:MAG: hypothetical protein MAG451_02591 [Anaerolineales bacterium]|nr:hypothetical protein [Anaerolineales bacterium]